MIKPECCPFCGKKKIGVEYNRTGCFCFASCENSKCHVNAYTLWHGSKEEAIKAWNKRAKEQEND